MDTAAANAWSQSEVIERWTKPFSTPVLIERYLRGQTTTDAETSKVGEIVEIWRERLTDSSWFMRCLNESIARMANKEDHCKGCTKQGAGLAKFASRLNPGWSIFLQDTDRSWPGSRVLRCVAAD